MHRIVLDRVNGFNESFERAVPHMYLDTKRKVTAGIGILLPDPDAAVRLGGWTDKATGAPAGAQAVIDEWHAVDANGIPGGWQHWTPQAKILLSRATMEAQALARARQAEAIFTTGRYAVTTPAEWDTLPADAQLGLISISWVGVGHYPRLIAAARAGNWFAAAGEATIQSEVAGQEHPRQTAQQQLFRNAGRVILRGLPRDELLYQGRGTAPRRWRAFLFVGNRYFGYDTGYYASDERPESDAPFPIDAGGRTSDWPGFAALGFGEGIDAALNYGNGYTYFFRGDRYLAYDMAANRIDGGVHAIDDGGDHAWRGMAAAGFAGGIDAAIHYGNGWTYFFRGDRYVAYDMAANRVAGAPVPIDSGTGAPGDWNGLARCGMADGIDSAINWGDGRIFFFKGSRYARYDLHTGVSGAPGGVSGDYPLDIADYWPGFGQMGAATGALTAAVDWG